MSPSRRGDTPRRGAIVSGGTSGIGEATVARLLADGFDVVTFSSDQQQVEKLRKRSTTWGDRLQVMVADVGSGDDVRAVVERAHESFEGTVSVVVNNAAVRPTGGISVGSLDDLDRAWQVNARGPIALTRAVLPGMIHQRSGSIVNVVSGASLGRPDLFAYAVSKGALLPFTASAALDLAPHHIRVNNVLPGTTKSGMTASRTGSELDAMHERARRNSVTGRPNFPEEVAAAIAWLASDDSSAVSGTTIEVGTLPRFSQ